MLRPSIIMAACGLLLALAACASQQPPELSRAECRIDPAPLSCAAETDADPRERR